MSNYSKQATAGKGSIRHCIYMIPEQVNTVLVHINWGENTRINALVPLHNAFL